MAGPKGSKAKSDDYKTYKTSKDVPAGAQVDTTDGGAPGGFYPGAARVIPGFNKMSKPKK